MVQRIPTYFDAPTSTITSADPNNDTIPTSMVPISQRQGNTITLQADGLYSGRGLALSTAFVSAVSGTDTPTSGTQAQPFQTIDFALQTLFGGLSLNGDLTILLKAGETFPINNRYTVSGGTLVFGWYADPQYGVYPGTPTSSGADPSVMEDLARPTISPVASLVGTQWQVGGFDFIGGAGTISLPGVFVGVPAIPSVQPANDAYSLRSDFVLWDQLSTGTLNLYGTLVNKPDNSLFGLCGAHARASRPTLAAYATQFLCAGAQVNSTTATTVQLQARQWFIKMYADFVGNNQRSTSPIPTAQNSSPGSAILSLAWSEVQAFAAVGTRKNLASFPKRFDTAFGIRNYFTGVVRDQQQRPLNVLAGFLGA